MLSTKEKTSETRELAICHNGERGSVVTMYSGPTRARDADGNVCDFTAIVRLRGSSKTHHKFASGLDNALKLHLELVEKMKNGEKIG